MENFEEIINNNDSLSKLINDRVITGFSDFSKTNYSDGLKNYIQDKYYSSFKEISQQCINDKNQVKINSLIRSIAFLATEKTKNLMAGDLNVILIKAYEDLLSFKESLPNNNELILSGNKLDASLNSVIINILNKLDTNDNIKESKGKIINAALDICDIVSKVSPKKEPFKYVIYNATINNLVKINDFGSLKERFDTHKRKIFQKRTGIEIKYWVGFIIAIILGIIKLFSIVR